MKTARYQTIKRSLVRQIQSGKLAPGDQLPSENWLSDRFQVSRMTARRAVTELVQEGLAIRQQGAGAFVATHRAMGSLLQIRSIDQEIANRGNRHRCQVLKLSKVKPSVAAAQALQVSRNQRVPFSQLVHWECLEDGTQLPIQVECRFVHPTWIPEYLKQDFQTMTPSQYLMNVAPLAQADHVVEACLPDDEIASLLQMPISRPCLKLTRTTSSHFLEASTEAIVVAFTELFHPGDRYQLGGHIETGV